MTFNYCCLSDSEQTMFSGVCMGMHSAEGAVGSCYTSHHIWQCDTHNRGRTLWWMVNRLLVEYNLASLHCSWVCGHTASSPQVLTHLPPTVTSRASITSHVVHKPPVSIKSSGTSHKHPTLVTWNPTHIPTTLGSLKLYSKPYRTLTLEDGLNWDKLIHATSGTLQ